MKRLEIINKMQKEEERKTYFENVLNDMESHYFEKATIKVDVYTQDFNAKHVEENPVLVNAVSFKSYLKTEISKCDNEITDLIKKLI